MLCIRIRDADPMIDSLLLTIVSQNVFEILITFLPGIKKVLKSLNDFLLTFIINLFVCLYTVGSKNESRFRQLIPFESRSFRIRNTVLNIKYFN